jgi:allophanate hydrolase
MSSTVPIPEDISIEALTTLYSTTSLQPSAVITEVYRRIAAGSDEAIFITLVPEATAQFAAKALSETHPDGPTPTKPLWGIPFSVKDSLDIASLPTTLACPTFAYEATHTAPCITRLLAAGAILIGKTNLDQLATGLNGTRSPYGVPHSVFSPAHISGGSSSGSAVSVAAHLVSFSVGTDTAGSTRVPAALNGLVGLKPTLGTISTVGLVPAVRTADCVTVLAKTVKSALAALEVMQTFDADDIFAREPAQLKLLDAQPRWFGGGVVESSRSLRYALPPKELLAELCPAYGTLFAHLVSLLPKLNLQQADTETFDYSPFAAANGMLYGSSIVAQRLTAFAPYIASHGFDKLDANVGAIFRASTGFDAQQAYKDMFALQEYRRHAARQFNSSAGNAEGIDFLLVPSTPLHPTIAEIQADPLALNARLGTFTHFVNLLDLCAVAVPLRSSRAGAGAQRACYRRSGIPMPFGVTLIALPGREKDLCQVAEKLMGVDLDLEVDVA